MTGDNKNIVASPNPAAERRRQLAVLASRGRGVFRRPALALSRR
jgi:hypothetical protein